jgi:hypothetical protein
VIQLQAERSRLFLCRLAAKLGHVNVDAMANTLTPDQVKEWQAVALIDGWDNGWNHTAEILSMLHSVANRICIMQSADPAKMHKASIWVSAGEFVKNLTSFGKKKDKPQTAMTPEQAEQILAARYSPQIKYGRKVR